MPAPVLGAAASKAFSILRSGAGDFSGVNGQIDHRAGGPTFSGMRVSEDGALRIGAAWIANTLIADEVSSLSYRLIRRDDAARTPVRPEELRPLWDRPNDDQTLVSFNATVSLSLTLWGASYTALEWTNGGGLHALWPQDPAAVRLQRDDDRSLRLAVAGKGELRNRPGRRPEFAMIPLFTLPGRLEPVSPVRYAAELLGLSQAYDATAARLMGRGMNPTAVLTFDQRVEPEEARAVSERLERLHGGPLNAGRVAVVGGPGAKLERMTMSMADAQFVAQRQDVFSLVMALWRVPPTVAGMVDKPSTWGTGVAEFARGLERFTLRPIVNRLQSGYEAYITGPVDPDLQVRFRFESMLSAAPKDKAEIQVRKLQAGLTSVERILAQDDEPPFTDGETVYSPLSVELERNRIFMLVRQAADTMSALMQAGMSQEEAAEAVGLEDLLQDLRGTRGG
jgi:HK97 family phage portal protein